MKKPYIKTLNEELVENKKPFRNFINRTEKKLNDTHNELFDKTEAEVWEEIDCLSCANCCKVMSPTYTKEDIERIAAHLKMSPARMKKKLLYYDKKSRDWMNTSTPCQFLDLKTNMCTIYEVRPADCAGFPHLSKKPLKDYFYIHKQNIEYCPATYRMIEKLKKFAEEKTNH